MAAIIVTAVATVTVYVVRQKRAAKTAPAPLQRMPASEAQRAQGFSISRTEAGRTLFKATAKKAVDYKETGKSELEDVEIIIYGTTGDRADRITSSKCEYDSKKGLIYSEGDVAIELASLPGQVPVPEAARAATGGPMSVRTSGLLFDQNKGVATTSRNLDFRFNRGQGHARGAILDSLSQTLWLKADVVLNVERDSPEDKVEIRAAELRYDQRQYQVQLTKPEFRRQDQLISANEAVLYLDEQHQAKNAVLKGNVKGRDVSSGRTSDFSAENLELYFTTGQVIQSAVVSGKVHVDSRSENSRTEIHAGRLEMAFTGPKSDLHQAQWKEAVRMVFHPAPKEARGQIKTVTSEHIEMVMKPGGAELAAARTVTPGRVEMTGGGQPGRFMTGGTFWVEFGAKSQVRQLRGDGKVRTESQPPANSPAGTPPRVTTSEHLVAYFSESTQQMESVEQTGNFRYEEGARQARGERAFYLAESGLTDLTGVAGQDPQVWEPSGRVTARKITLNEKTNEAFAEGNVRATQIPQPGDKPNALLAKTDASKSDPMNAVADKLRWDRRSGITRYEGGPSGRTRLWQGQNVVEAKVVEMDRSGKRLTATGEAFSFLVEEGKEPLRVNAERLTYTDEDRHVRYERNVILRTQDMVMTAAAVDAWLLPADQVKAGESRLDRALATGNVKLDQPRRPAEGKKPAVPARRGQAERADYFAQKDTIVLSGGNPIVTDELRGSTTGRELTYHIADDRITVVGDDNVRTLTEHRVTKKSR